MTGDPGYAAIEARANARNLTILGGFHIDQPIDAAPDARTMLLFGPHEPGFWERFRQTPEWRDQNPDPFDAWSRREISELSRTLGGTPLFPFDGPPYHPFFDWALKTGRVWASPVLLLVHDVAGLLVSFRGAIALTRHIDLPPVPAHSPCETCADRPCLTTCPVNALTPDEYVLTRCHAHLDRPEGAACLNAGCLARRACPVSQRYPRNPAQSAHHMSRFHP